MTHLADDPDDPYMFCLAVNKFHGDRIGLAGYRRCALVQLGMGHSKLRLAVGSASAGVASSNDLMCKGKTWYTPLFKTGHVGSAAELGVSCLLTG
jgi:hypothetical protein